MVDAYSVPLIEQNTKLKHQWAHMSMSTGRGRHRFEVRLKK